MSDFSCAPSTTGSRRHRLTSTSAGSGRRGSGRNSATGSPSRVTVSASPFATRAKTSAPRFRRSRIVTSAMHTNVSPVRQDRPWDGRGRICDNGLSQLVGRPLPPVAGPCGVRTAGGGGKSELQRAVRRVMPGQGDLTESGTENIPPWFAEVRVKRCGKSAPRRRQRRWQAKPRTEQDQIGWRLRTARLKPPGRSLEPASDRGPRGMVVPPTRHRARTRTEFGLSINCDAFSVGGTGHNAWRHIW